MLNGRQICQIWPKLKLFQAFMVVLITCKNEEDTTKNEGTRVLETSYIDFSDAQREAVSCMNGDDPIKNDGPRL